jgi:NAD(P)-dependent dehydrogenase (short-subunit alcohol dehydrogenase family)
MDFRQQEQLRPAQHQSRQPGLETKMTPRPVVEDPAYKSADRLTGKVALITGGDSGIGRAVAIAYAKEGADIAIVHLAEESEDAEETCRRIEELGRRCILLTGDVGDPQVCNEAVKEVVDHFGHLDVLVNNAAEQHVRASLKDISDEQLERTFRTNIFSMFFLTRAALPHLHSGAAIINTASVNAYEGNPGLIDYSFTKGAIVGFTRSLALALALAGKGIRVNGVAPGPI